MHHVDHTCLFTVRSTLLLAAKLLHLREAEEKALHLTLGLCSWVKGQSAWCSVTR